MRRDRNDTGVGPLCGICSKAMGSSKLAILEHARQHIAESSVLRYRCPGCLISFTYLHDLDAHNKQPGLLHDYPEGARKYHASDVSPTWLEQELQDPAASNLAYDHFIWQLQVWDDPVTSLFS